MKKKKSIVSAILTMVCVTPALLSIIISAVGATMIYYSTESSVKSQIEYAALTLCNLYDLQYHGEYYMKDNALYKGETKLTEREFTNTARNIGGSSEMDFTIFWGDTRMFTSIKNDDGSYAVGTKATMKVVNDVLLEGKEYYYRDVNINGNHYAGFYIPIVNSSAETVGMIFAGKPAVSASETAFNMVIVFLGIALGVTVISVTICMIYLRKIVKSLIDIKQYMIGISDCDFSSSFSSKTIERNDEIGDIARSAEKLRDNLRDLIERDALTALFNRRSCRRQIDALHSANTPLVFVMCDIDFFKKINDTYGHAIGDSVLVEVSDSLKRYARLSGSFVARWGGEEFLMVFPNRPYNNVVEILNDLINDIRNLRVPTDMGDVSVTMTFGASEHRNNETIDDTINRADALLYEGKQSGRNRIVTQ